MTSSIKSFTEHALFNKYALNVLCPSNCELKEIEQKGDSVLDAIEQARTDVFSNPLKTSKLHTALKPVRFVARIVYTLAVCVLISPLGVAFNGTRLSFNLTKWAFCKAVGWEGAKNDAKVKTKEIAYYFFLDLGSFIYGVTISVVGAGAYAGFIAPVSIVEKLFSLTLGVGVLTWLTEAYAPDSFLPRFLSNDEDRAGMYISLALRNRLGICGKGGSLLKYGEGDAIVKESAGYNQWNFKGAGKQKLQDLVFRAELQLLDDVREAKEFLSKNGVELHFSHPFNGNEVASKIDKIVKAKSKQSQPAASNETSNEIGTYDETEAKIGELMSRLRTQQSKITLLLEIEKKARAISLEASPQLTVIMMMARQSPPRYTIPDVKTYVREEYARSWFDIPSSTKRGAKPSAGAGGATPANNSKFEFSNLNVDRIKFSGLDPATTPKNDENNLYARFNRKIRENIWKLGKNEPTDSPYSLIDLNDDFSEADSRRAYRKYALVLHPDKNRGANMEEAQMLFQALENINAAMKKELEKRK